MITATYVLLMCQEIKRDYYSGVNHKSRRENVKIGWYEYFDMKSSLNKLFVVFERSRPAVQARCSTGKYSCRFPRNNVASLGNLVAGTEGSGIDVITRECQRHDMSERCGPIVATEHCHVEYARLATETHCAVR